jgi:acetyl-CoA C-acetyltransferase
MRDVVVAGIGRTPVGEHWEKSLRELAVAAIMEALRDGGMLRPQSIYIGNFLGFASSGQSNLGALLVDYAGLDGIEGVTVEAGEASGGAAFRQGYLAVASGFVDSALVVGVEKCSDIIGSAIETYASQSLDYDYEVVQGLTPVGQAALLMQRYIHIYDVPQHALGIFPRLSHANAVHNPCAMYPRELSQQAYEKASMVSTPLNMFDRAPYADGAAAVLLTHTSKLSQDRYPTVQVVGSSTVTDTLAMHDRPDPMGFQAVSLSIERAIRQAGILPEDLDFFELSDHFSIFAALTLEAAGFAPRGKSWQLAQEGNFDLHGKLPLCTMGGAKGRGHPLGATGVYQVVEAVMQLRGLAGECQVKNPRWALVQSLGGPATTAVTHVLERIRSSQKTT